MMGTAMKRSDRLGLVKKVVDDFERRKAEALAAAERRVAETEKKLQDLEAYRDGYVHDFAIRAKTGIFRNSIVSPQLMDNVPTNTMVNLAKAGRGGS